MADFSGNSTLIEQLSTEVKRGGRVASSATRLDAAAYAGRGLRAMQINQLPYGRMPELLELITSGRLRVPSMTVMPLADAAAALEGAAAKQTRGKVVLEIA